jgi:hypothetical protein
MEKTIVVTLKTFEQIIPQKLWENFTTIDSQFYKKTVVVQNKSNLLLKIFLKTFKHYNF